MAKIFKNSTFLRKSYSTKNNHGFGKLPVSFPDFYFLLAHEVPFEHSTWPAAARLAANLFLRETIESFCQKRLKGPKDSSPNLKLYNQRTNLCSSACGSRREKGDSSGICWIFSSFSLAIRFLWAINGIHKTYKIFCNKIESFQFLQHVGWTVDPYTLDLLLLWVPSFLRFFPFFLFPI